MNEGSYLLGVCAAIAAGVAFNLGLVIQKVAVSRVKGQVGLIRQLIRNRLWLTGALVQLLVGVPMNLLAQAKVGPVISPGLMATGLIVLALGAVYLAGESFGRADVAGIVLVMAAIALFGLSRLGVDMATVDLYDAGFLTRLGTFSAGVAALSLTCHLLQSRIPGWCGILRTIDAGLFLAQSNLWLAVLSGFLALWGSGQFSPRDLLGAGTAALLATAGGFLGLAETQRAFQVGDASKLVPIQSMPQQILPLVSFFAVFNLTPPGAAALPLALTGAALIVAGSVLLARRQAVLS
jgi:drug/metabolite transporter (DMT)-like permease